MTTTSGEEAKAATTSSKISLDQIASVLLRENFMLTALELHTELCELGREVPRLRDFFSNPANFEQTPAAFASNSYSSSSLNYNNNNNGGAGYPLHKASSIQTFDSLDLTRYSDDPDQQNKQEDKIAVLEFELRKANRTINHLRNTLTVATATTDNGKFDHDQYHRRIISGFVLHCRAYESIGRIQVELKQQPQFGQSCHPVDFSLGQKQRKAA